MLKVSLRYPYGYLSHLTDMLTKADKINCTDKLLPHSQYDGKFKIYIYMNDKIDEVVSVIPDDKITSTLLHRFATSGIIYIRRCIE